jgi:hypothetical protein
MKRGKKILLGLAALGVAIQFIRPQKNLSAAPPGKDDLATHYNALPEVRRLLATACYDCHSNHTRYPWYAEVQPVGWFLAKHVRDGKRELNFNEFAAYSPRTQVKKLAAISDEVGAGDMPLKSYTWIHRDARLSGAQIKTLTDWADALHDKLEAER